MFVRLLVLFIVVPLVELYLLLQIGARIGLFTTIATIILTGALGAYLTKQQGLKTLERFRAATNEGRLPHKEIIDGLLILIAGAVLLTPGFLTDIAGFTLLVPPVRALFHDRLANYLKTRTRIVVKNAAGAHVRSAAARGINVGADPAARDLRNARPVDGRVIDADVEVEAEPAEPPPAGDDDPPRP